MSTPEIAPKAFFGLRSSVRQNAHFISDFQVLYPAGSVLVLQNYYEKRQRYIKLYEKSLSLEFISVSPSRKYVALIENAERGQVVIYDLQTFKRRRILNLPADSITNRFETVTFSHDDKYVVAVTGDPDWAMISYNWKKGKVDSSTKANSSNATATVAQVCCSPTDSSELCLVGAGLFRLLSKNETVWRQYGFQKADQINITCACWLTNERILCGTADGKLLLIEGGELRAAFNAVTVTVINVHEKEELGASASSMTLMKTFSDYSGDEDRQVRALLSFPKGFAYSCKTGYVHMFEKESSNKYKKRNVFRVLESEFRECLEFELNTVNHMSINVSQDKLLATTNRAQIYMVRLWGPDMNVAPEISFKILGEPIHHGSITGLSMCVWKPIFLTCGQFDRTVRLWNYENQKVEMVKQFDEDIFSIALHPTGYFAAIGFPGKLRIMIIVLDDIQPLKDYPIEKCTVCKFSSHGHFLAAGNYGVVEIYSYITLQNICSLKGHNDHVRSLVWSSDDKKLISCGSEGTIIEWDMITFKKMGELETPGVSYTNCAITSDGKFIYAVGSDGLVKEIRDSNIIRVIDLNQKRLDRIILSRSDVMMFLSGDYGSVLSVRIPISSPAEFTPFFYHYSNITHMQLSYDDQTLVTASVGGAVIIWKLSRIEGKTIAMEKDFSYSKEVLIGKLHLQDQINLLKDLTLKLSELEMDHIHKVKVSESAYSEKIMDIQVTYNQAIEELKEKIDQLETDQENQLLRIKQDVDELELKEEQEKEDLEKNYGAKLALEGEKLATLNVEKEEIAATYGNNFVELTRSKERATEELIKMYETKLIKINKKLQESYEMRKQNVKEHGKIKQTYEEDADRELVETRASYEKLLREERENNELLKTEARKMKQKYVSAQKEIDEYRQKIEVLHADHQKHQGIIQALEKDIYDLKKEIEDRDVTFEDKDRRIYDLKKKILELEKYKLVLDYKIKELKTEIDPKDREIREKNEQIQDMVKELENLQKISTSLELQEKELKEKIISTEKEVAKYNANHQSGVNTLRKIQVDLYDLYQHIDDFKFLKDGIKNINLKYNQDEVLVRGQSLDSDLQKEFMIQREFLEKTIISLQSTISKNKELKKDDQMKILEDNVVLVEELNHMRQLLKDTIRKVRNLENLLGIKTGKSVTPREAYNKLQHCLKKQEAIKNEYEEVAEMARVETDELNNRVASLQDQINALFGNEK